jgi:hypothetical protein
MVDGWMMEDTVLDDSGMLLFVLYDMLPSPAREDAALHDLLRCVGSSLCDGSDSFFFFN